MLVAKGFVKIKPLVEVAQNRLFSVSKTDHSRPRIRRRELNPMSMDAKVSV
jgi:hypothetical protein